jgi:hypothetical protein
MVEMILDIALYSFIVVVAYGIYKFVKVAVSDQD